MIEGIENILKCGQRNLIDQVSPLRSVSALGVGRNSFQGPLTMTPHHLGGDEGLSRNGRGGLLRYQSRGDCLDIRIKIMCWGGEGACLEIKNTNYSHN